MNILSNFPMNDNKNDLRTGPAYYIPIAVIITLLLIGFFWLGYLMISIPEYFGEMEGLKGEPIPKVIEVEEKEAEPEPDPEPVVHLTDDDMIAMVVMREAGNQEMIGNIARLLQCYKNSKKKQRFVPKYYDVVFAEWIPRIRRTLYEDTRSLF